MDQLSTFEVHLQSHPFSQRSEGDTKACLLLPSEPAVLVYLVSPALLPAILGMEDERSVCSMGGNSGDDRQTQVGSTDKEIYM
jgi:hypothetical protein